MMSDPLQSSAYLGQKSILEVAQVDVDRVYGKLRGSGEIDDTVTFDAAKTMLDTVGRNLPVLYIYLSKYFYREMPVENFEAIVWSYVTVRSKIASGNHLLYSFANLEEYVNLFRGVSNEDRETITEIVFTSQYFPRVSELLEFTELSRKDPEIPFEFRWKLTVSQDSWKLPKGK